LDKSNSIKELFFFFKKPNIVKRQNIVLGMGPVLLNKDGLYLLRILRITTLKAKTKINPQL